MRGVRRRLSDAVARQSIQGMIATLGMIVFVVLVAVGVLIYLLLSVSDTAHKAKAASEKTDRTITSVIAEARAAAVDPLNVAAQLRSRERIIAICRAVGAACPEEPSTTTTTVPSEGD